MQVLKFLSVIVKSIKFAMSFFKAQVSSSLKFAVLWHITPLHFFDSNIIYFPQKKHNKVQIFRLATARTEVHQIPDVIFGTKGQFFSKLCITLQCNETQFFCTFSWKTWYTLGKMSQLKCKFLDVILLAWGLANYYAIFQAASPLNFASPLSVMTHNSYEIF